MPKRPLPVKPRHKTTRTQIIWINQSNSITVSKLQQTLVVQMYYLKA